MAIPTLRTEIKQLLLAALWIVFGVGYFARFPLPGLISTLYDLLFALVITGSAWGFGSLLVTNNLQAFLSTEEEFIMAILSGFGILSLLMIGAGIIDGWTRMGMTLLIGAGLCLVWKDRARMMTGLVDTTSHLRRIPKIPLVLIMCGSGLSFLAAFTPIIYYDSLVYHFALPNAYIHAGHWVGQTDLIYSAFPQMMEMLWTLGSGLVNDSLANLLGWIIAMLGTATVFFFGQRYFGTKTGAWGAAIMGSMPAYILLATGGYIDIGLTVYGFMSFFALWLGIHSSTLESKESACPRLLVLSGFYAGCAIGCKYTGGISMGIGVILLLLESRRYNIKEILRMQMLYVGTAMLAFSPWLIKNLHYVGNPVFPFFYRWSFAHQNPWIGDAAAGYFRGLTEYTPRSGWQLITLVWDIGVKGLNLGGGMDVLGDLGWAPLFALIPALWLVRKKSPTIGVLLLYSICFFVPWGMSRPVLRFLLPLVPFLALAAAYAFDQGINTQTRTFKWLAQVFLALLLMSSFHTYFDVADTLSLFKVPLGFMSREHYLSQKLDYFDAANYVNSLPPSSLTYVIGDQRGYYYNSPVLITPVFNTNPLTDWANDSQSAEDLASRLKTRHITHLLINNSEMARLDVAYHLFPFTPKGLSNWDTLKSHFATLVYHDPHCDIFALM